MTREQWIDEFLQFQAVDRSASAQTISAYRSDLQQFFEFLSQKIEVETIQADQVIRFFQHLTDLKFKAASIARKMSTLRRFFRFACLEKNLATNPMENIEHPTPTQRLPKFLTHSEIESLLFTATQGIPYPSPKAQSLQARDRAMIYLLYATGVRVSELIQLTFHQIDLSEGYLRVSGKGGKERIAPFAPVAGEYVAQYLKDHRVHLNPKTESLFVNHHGSQMTRQGFWKMLKALAVQARIEKPIFPHLIRHSFATHLLQSGIQLRSLQVLLGHSDLTTTQIYTHVTPQHLQEAHSLFHPRGGDEIPDLKKDPGEA